MYLTIGSLFEQATFLVISLIFLLALPEAIGKEANSNIVKSFKLSPTAIVSFFETPISLHKLNNASP